METRPDSATARTGPLSDDWTALSDEQLLEVRMCDLPIAIEGSWLEGRIAALFEELDARGLTFRPHFWLSAEWFSPDGVPGVAIPFYLAHPRLMRLENAQMLEVEGGELEWCMKILRHEAGHAFDNAYELRRRPKRRKLFGSPHLEYPEFYLPKPYSKSFVLHLDSWYAQSHPDEDFAETFAVWLAPGADWRNRYADWPALRKLEYMDGLMREVSKRRPVNQSRRRVEPLNRLTRTLGAHYREKREHYGLDRPNFTDRDLRRLFSDDAAFAANPAAATFIRRVRREVRRQVSEWTGTYQYTIDQLIEDMIARVRELKLRLKYGEERTTLDFTILLTVQTMNHLHSGRHRVAL
jgi:hypothetical protein